MTKEGVKFENRRRRIIIQPYIEQIIAWISNFEHFERIVLESIPFGHTVFAKLRLHVYVLGDNNDVITYKYLCSMG